MQGDCREKSSTLHFPGLIGVVALAGVLEAPPGYIGYSRAPEVP